MMNAKPRPRRKLVSKLLSRAMFAFGAVAAGVVGAHLLVLTAERQAAAVRRLATMTRMGAAVAEQGPTESDRHDGTGPFTRWAWAALAEPAVVGTALLAGDGAVLSVQPDDIADPLTLARAAPDGAILDTAVGPARMISVRTASGRRVVLLAKPFGVTLPRSVPHWAFASLVLLAAVLAWGWLRIALERSVSRPLRRICAVHIGDGVRRAKDLPIDRDDELGDLARCLHDVLVDRNQTENRMSQLKRTMDARVASRIRQVQGMLKRAERRAWIDPLTKLGNRRLLDDRLEEVYATQTRRGEDMSAIMFDVDNFKHLNDTLGHAAGDELLRFVGELLRGSLRSSDIGLRLGGDEFVAILLGAGTDEAAETADRLTKLFRQKASLFKLSKPVTISCGIASIRQPHADSGEALLAMADKALYAAKARGKGRVSIHLATPPATARATLR